MVTMSAFHDALRDAAFSQVKYIDVCDKQISSRGWGTEAVSQRGGSPALRLGPEEGEDGMMLSC
jgi:hypothetical protein